MKISNALIQSFISQKTLAILGVSRNKSQFANAIYKLLKQRGYKVYAINPFAENIENDKCYSNIKFLPEKVDGVIIMISKQKTFSAVKEVIESGIKQIWLQQGTETEEAIKFCKENNVDLIYGECILMFIEPVTFPHNLHRWINKICGKLPA